ncbi:L-gulonolactone/D-arabinono-1,4-lactone oxidase [Cryphonectria parasitica EP155]|uniref:D-arabinono-1,4-lactone oxidase n=1 Tax=Cryphonectria parasitica (strain ATCC 38755 / EP155) TaxID=660469 RepID=A0A9P5CN31_CRYP1|nr:L-gulonolactone/D-arabinono-1,4-lactone oxidase [Cryphonectria parasitica EP155]KAF3765019.1 L-gulonolactone/D-arabinono-1,4-lactone oxidase [Cryphonectria parasitica EP155]
MASTTDLHLAGLDQRVLDAIQKSSSDDIPFRATMRHAHSTWARTFTCAPELYIRPRSVAEVQKAVNLARVCRRRITTTGAGHSPSDITCTSSWLVNLDDLRAILGHDEKTGVVHFQAGIRLWQLGEELDRMGLAMPNLGSINEQSAAGVISTGTHGSSLHHALISQSIVELAIVTADGRLRTCSRDRDNDLFRAALLSLGALGIIVEIKFQTVPAYSLRWHQTIDSDAVILRDWDTTLWDRGHFVRVWWFPHTRRSVVWAANITDEAHYDQPASWYDGVLGYYVYHNLLWLAQYVPSILPAVERFVFGMQYGFADGTTTSAVQPQRKALLMNCLYSQYVNEWAIPLHKGPEALRRLSCWLNHLQPGDRDYCEHGIPFSSEGLYVHAPLEVRVTDTSRFLANTDGTGLEQRPFLDPTCRDGPTLYLNATLYRPYDLEPPCLDRYYQAFEWLMRDLDGRPHWAKNFATVTTADVEGWYGADLDAWRAVRDMADPRGMFAGSWHRRTVLGGAAALPLEEREEGRMLRRGRGWFWSGRKEITS